MTLIDSLMDWPCVMDWVHVTGDQMPVMDWSSPSSPASPSHDRTLVSLTRGLSQAVSDHLILREPRVLSVIAALVQTDKLETVHIVLTET